MDVGVESDIISKSGAFYSFGDTRLGQGRENSKNFLKEHKEITDNIEKLIRDKLKAESEAGVDKLRDETTVAVNTNGTKA